MPKRFATVVGMRREITWIEKLPDRTKREVRVHFYAGKTFWRDRVTASRRAREGETWNENVEPSEADWEHLLEEVKRRFQRRTARQEDIDLVLKRVVGEKRGLPSQRFGKEL